MLYVSRFLAPAHRDVNFWINEITVNPLTKRKATCEKFANVHYLLNCVGASMGITKWKITENKHWSNFKRGRGNTRIIMVK